MHPWLFPWPFKKAIQINSWALNNLAGLSIDIYDSRALNNTPALGHYVIWN